MVGASCHHQKSENAGRATNGQTRMSSFPRRAFKRQCTEDGSWLEGACEPVTCEPPPAIFHGSYRCTDGFRFDSVCKLNCTDPAGNTASAAAAGGSAHTVRLLHAPCKQVCPSSLSTSFYSSFPCLFLSVFLSSLSGLYCKFFLSFFQTFCLCT